MKWINTMDMFDLLYKYNHATLSDTCVATLAEWAQLMRNGMGTLRTHEASKYSGDYRRAFALIREGCDLLLRLRAFNVKGVCPECLSTNPNETRDVPNEDLRGEGKYFEWWRPWEYTPQNSHRCTNSFHKCS